MDGSVQAFLFLLMGISGTALVAVIVVAVRDLNLKTDLKIWRTHHGDRVPTRTELRQFIAKREAHWREQDRRRDEIERASFQHAKEQMKRRSRDA